MAIEFDDADFDVSDWRITYGCCSELEYEIDGVSAIVHSINATPSGCGIGTALCRKFENLAVDAGCEIISVPVSLTFEAVSFWKAMGYDLQNKQEQRKMSKIIEHDYELCDDTQGVIVLEKIL